MIIKVQLPELFAQHVLVDMDVLRLSEAWRSVAKHNKDTLPKDSIIKTKSSIANWPLAFPWAFSLIHGHKPAIS